MWGRNRMNWNVKSKHATEECTRAVKATERLSISLTKYTIHPHMLYKPFQWCQKSAFCSLCVLGMKVKCSSFHSDRDFKIRQSKWNIFFSAIFRSNDVTNGTFFLFLSISLCYLFSILSKIISLRLSTIDQTRVNVILESCNLIFLKTRSVALCREQLTNNSAYNDDSQFSKTIPSSIFRSGPSVFLKKGLVSSKLTTWLDFSSTVIHLSSLHLLWIKQFNIYSRIDVD